jgi:putative colanic acid biosynthesis UDP-glucose lipid carrier transferase
MERHTVKPGVTGLAQALGWRGDTHELWMMEERVRHDLYYIRHRSIKMDLAIIRRSLGQFIEPPESAQ